MLDYIDLYCERTGPAFWNEPVNALSNIAFIVAAAIAWRHLSRRGGADYLERVVVILAAGIGVGSFLFHTFASRWSEYADIIPIWSFVVLLVLLCIYRMTGQSVWRTAKIAAVAIAVTLVVTRFTNKDLVSNAEPSDMLLNGSMQYAPALLALALFTGLAFMKKLPIRHHFMIAGVLFLASLSFRTIDLAVCNSTSGIGTHFLWHILNGAMIAVLLNGVITHLPPASVGRASR